MSKEAAPTTTDLVTELRERAVGHPALMDRAASEIERLRDALFRAQQRFELFAAGGVGVTKGACPRVGAQEAKAALRGWRPE